jgi:glycine/D-amino acid oxidase-like deaminating enzyme
MISRLDGVLSVGSTGGRDYDQNNLFLGEEYDSIPTETAKLELLQRAIDVLPELESAELIQQLAGSRPLSPDRMPIVGPVPGMDGIVLATGHSTKGIHLGPITGRIIAEYIQSGCTRIPQEMEAFLPSRFKTASAIDFHASGQLVDE